MSELTQRIITSLIAAPVFLYLTWLGGWPFLIAVVVISGVIQLEVINMLEKQELVVQRVPALLMGVPVVLMPVYPQAWAALLMVISMLVVMATFNPKRKDCADLTPAFFAGLFTPALLSGLVMLRNIGDDSTGFALTVSLLLMVWANDVFAFAGGSTTGRRPLAPSISPSKTVEGFLWGFVGCFAALWLSYYLLPPFEPHLLTGMVFAVLVGLAGPAGDLAESRLKRTSGIKHSSSVMPGHGGLYDRFDALLMAAPVAAVYFQVVFFFGWY